MPAVRRRPTRRTATRLLGSCSSRRRRRTAPLHNWRNKILHLGWRQRSGREKAGCSLRRDARGGPPPPEAAARAAPAEPQYTYILYGVNFAKDIAYRPHCEKCGKSDGRGGSARSDRAKSAVFRDRSASDAARARSFSPCLTFWYFWVKPKVR